MTRERVFFNDLREERGLILFYFVEDEGIPSGMISPNPEGELLVMCNDGSEYGPFTSFEEAQEYVRELVQRLHLNEVYRELAKKYRDRGN